MEAVGEAAICMVVPVLHSTDTACRGQQLSQQTFCNASAGQKEAPLAVTSRYAAPVDGNADSNSVRGSLTAIPCGGNTREAPPPVTIFVAIVTTSTPPPDREQSGDHRP